MKKASSWSGTGEPAATVAGRGTGTETGDRAAVREALTHRRRGIRLHAEGPAAAGWLPTPRVSPASDTVELASHRGAEGDDEWDDTSEEPVLVVHGIDGGTTLAGRPDPSAVAAGKPAGSGNGSSGASPVVAPRRGISAGHPLAVLLGVLGLATGGTALWLTASAQAEVERIQATLALPAAHTAARAGRGSEAAWLAELRVAVERLQGRVAALEEASDRAFGSAEPGPTQSPAARQGDAPVFDGVWRLELPRLEGPTAVIPATELAAAWSQVRWPEVSGQRCTPGHDGGCGGGGEGGR